MLKELRISNLVLVESAEIAFSQGLTAITGETGAGKTVLLEALKLATGQRADSDAVRRGAAKATVEAAFEIKAHPEIARLIDEAGLTWSPEESLLLKREISQEGRSRAFINCQMVPLSLLNTIGARLVDFTDQHAHHDLRKEEYQREAIDLYGNLASLAKDAQMARRHLQKSENELASLQQALLTSQKESERLAVELEELREAGLKQGEEEALSSEHSRLSHTQEIGSKLSGIIALFDDPPFALIAQLKKCFPLLKSASSLDPTLSETQQLLSQGIVTIEEVRNLLQTYLGKLESDPQRAAFLEERLAVYHKFRRKYGDPFAYSANLQETLERLELIDEDLQAVAKQKEEAARKLMALRLKLAENREKAAHRLADALTKILRSLHMPHAEIEIRVLRAENPLVDDDRVEFLLKANRGEKQALVKEHASGGELARLMLALQTALAEHQPTPVFVFDEVDANVGGQTASAIAEKLAAIAEYRQVLCVTHFSQVAKRCGHHVRIFKEEIGDRTITRLQTLDPQGREREFQRMNG